MKQTILISLILLINTIVFAQEREINCPVIGVNPPAAASPGESMRFSTSLDENLIKNLNLKIVWTTDVGTIISGQGTKEIVVATDGLENTTIIASIKVLGIPGRCGNKYSDTGIVLSNPYTPCHLPDEFGEIPNDDVRVRIDSLFISLQSNPDSIAYIESFGLEKEIINRERLVKNHVKFRGYDASRIIFVRGKKQKVISTTLFVIPLGFDPAGCVRSFRDDNDEN